MNWFWAAPIRWVVVIAVAGGLGLFYGAFVPVTGKPTASDSMPECPHDWSKRDRVVAEVAGQISDIPEFHDCQRLIVRDDGATVDRYDSLAAVFAKEGLQFVNDDSLMNGVVLGLVYFPTTGSYDHLNLTAQHSCIVVTGKPEALFAWMVPISPGSSCFGPISAMPLPPELVLEVRRTVPVNPDHPDSVPEVPAVARWDWDAATGRHFIGIRCGEGWCEIGKKPLGNSPDHLAAAGLSFTDAPALSVKGWYDEQRLAEFPADVATPAMNVGTVVPSRRLEAFASKKPEPGVWDTVAHVYMHPNTGTYATTFNFASDARRPPNAASSTVELCAGSWLTCRTNSLRYLRPRACTPDVDGNRWYARITAPNGKVRYFCVVYRPHPHDFSVPAVVRWRWRNDDESIWVRCPAGCCEVNGDE